MQFQRTKNAVLSLVGFWESNKGASFKTSRNIECGKIVTRSKQLITVQSVIKSMLERENPLQMCTLCFCGQTTSIVKIQQWAKKQLKFVRAKKSLQKSILAIQSLARSKVAREQIVKQKNESLQKSILAIQSLARSKAAQKQLIRQKNEKVVVESIKPAPKKTKRTKMIKKTKKSSLGHTHRCSNPNCWKNHPINFTPTLFKGEYLWEDKKSVIKIKASTKKLTVAKAPKFHTSRRSRTRSRRTSL